MFWLLAFLGGCGALMFEFDTFFTNSDDDDDDEIIHTKLPVDSF